MKYEITLKGTVPSIKIDSILNKHFSDSSGYGYFKIDIEADNDEELSKELYLIKKGTDLKVIGINY